MDKLHAAGRNAKNSKKIIDQAAAIEILQEWLDLRAGY
jgi:RNase H-fold protein (predicted Holliday junction resolvase)